MRLFFALWPPPDAASALAQWALEARRATGGKVTAEAKIHLTLAFLGEVDPKKAASAARRMHVSPHDLPIEQAGYWRQNGIVWAGPRVTPPALMTLFAALSLELYKEGFILERRPFAAHVTLIRKVRAAKSLPALPSLEWPVKEMLLVRSSLSAAGPAYECLERFSLE